MPLEIPCRPDLTNYEFPVVLDDVTFTFEFRWNGREGSWYFDILRQDRTPIVLGTKVVVNIPLAARSRNSLKPPGRIVAVDTSGRGQAPGKNDLGDRVKLIYVPAAEIT